jgi:hypothetical protein
LHRGGTAGPGLVSGIHWHGKPQGGGWGAFFLRVVSYFRLGILDCRLHALALSSPAGSLPAAGDKAWPMPARLVNAARPPGGEARCSLLKKEPKNFCF